MQTQIEFKRIKECSELELIDWLSKQFIVLSKDFGSKINHDDLDHLSSRIYEILLENYSGMHVGNLKPIFGNGLAGAYGTSSRLTVQTILIWITSAYKSKITQNASTEPIEEEGKFRTKRYYDEIYDHTGEFVVWMWRNDVDIPEEYELIPKQVSPIFAKYRDLYYHYKKLNQLHKFKSMMAIRKSIISNI